jgi:GT2 family glycosyltransferase
MKHSNLISLVVTTYNRSDALLAVLGGLAQQSDTGFEVIIADDGSNVQHQQVVLNSEVAKQLKAIHVWHPDIGFTASRVRNRGVSVSSGAYVVFLDGDCVPETDFVHEHRRLMQAGCFVNGSRVMLSSSWTEKILADGIGVQGQSIPFWMRHRLQGHASKLTGLVRLPDFSARCNAHFSWKGIRSCNMGVWHTDFVRVNGFDESFVGWGHEDADFVLRLHNAGVVRKNGFCATEVYHLWHRESSRAQESKNADRVRERQRTLQVLPTEGYSDSVGGKDMVITRLG